MSVRTRSGREAVTSWRVLERYPRSGVSLLEIRPETGRTHQIRVHLAASGMPILGDPVYGRGRGAASGAGGGGAGTAAAAALTRPALHAAVLGFDHPSRGERLRFEAPFPQDLAGLHAGLREESDAADDA
jgi:23S rRNA pseudouridine1911/1915/1917 synthase